MQGDILINYFLKETENNIFVRYLHVSKSIKENIFSWLNYYKINIVNYQKKRRKLSMII